MKKILVTGSSGFITGYLVPELLNNGYEVIGIDNYSKYGKVAKNHDNHPNYKLVIGDCKDTELMKELIKGCDQVVAAAALIGGISYFHEHAYDLMANNERILAATFDAAINEFKNGDLNRIIVLSSSMVFENATKYPTPENHIKECPPPSSTYGFQKLAAEYFAQGAYEQYKLPYTIVRPFNCVGVGEGRALSDQDIFSGNIKLALSHVLPDLAQKTLKGQYPLRILGEGNQVRHYTHGKDLARGIRLAMESKEAINNDFNISTSESTTVLELAKLVWEVVNPNTEFIYETDKPYTYDVQMRTPDTSKAKNILGFEANINLKDSVKEVVDWVKNEVEAGRI
jgi:UDP-glucose 4-epimerase